MFMQWLRSNRYAALLLTLVRLYVGYEFLHAGWEKIFGEKPFDASGFLKNAIAHPVLGPDKTEIFPTFTAFLKNFALPHVGIFNFLVPWGELLVGLGLILGVLTTAAMFFGVLMNFLYLMAGTVSSNPWDIFLGMFILAAGYNAGMFGGDYWVIPWVRGLFKRGGSGSTGSPNALKGAGRRAKA
ncbi:DoxX family membrane protein [Tumebacillus flagellatus]|uniref:Crp/Fnr family transcriptional regulator n=1 Tax=Tumebacillus flagellatus TaxID=1157490 RepID=A0A074LYZ1_9BACL|nr:DoxX family membrane protein [Tumebacillus flagellatus]KEO85283.1 Crp/Fnr family transcriptional regulator [Tumebacillus flagellatus]